MMQSTAKLGADRSITGLIPALSSLVSIALVWMFFGKETAFLWTTFIFAAFCGLALFAYFRTRSLGYLASVFYLLSCTLMLSARTGVIPGGRDIAPAFSILFMVATLCLLFALFTRQTKWRGRDIMELAATPVLDENGAFTGRPYPVGKANYTRDELYDFADFARRKLLAMPYHETNRVVFVPVKMGSEFGHLFKRNRDYSADTWVAFEDDGNVTVNISQADYLDYKNDLDHEALCRSLADVFLDFLQMHRNGRQARIIDRLDAMKIGFFS